MPEHAAPGWARLPALAAALPAPPAPGQWLAEMLARNRHCAYLQSHGSPATLAEFRRQVPVCGHDDLAPWIERSLADGARDVLFAGAPVGCACIQALMNRPPLASPPRRSYTLASSGAKYAPSPSRVWQPMQLFFSQTSLPRITASDMAAWFDRSGITVSLCNTNDTNTRMKNSEPP